MQLVVVLGVLEPFQGHRLCLFVTAPLDVCPQTLPEGDVEDALALSDYGPEQRQRSQS